MKTIDPIKCKYQYRYIFFLIWRNQFRYMGNNKCVNLLLHHVIFMLLYTFCTFHIFFFSVAKKSIYYYFGIDVQFNLSRVWWTYIRWQNFLSIYFFYSQDSNPIDILLKRNQSVSRILYIKWSIKQEKFKTKRERESRVWNSRWNGRRFFVCVWLEGRKGSV